MSDYQEGWNAHARYLDERRKVGEVGSGWRLLSVFIGYPSLMLVGLIGFSWFSGVSLRDEALPLAALGGIGIPVGVWLWRKADRKSDEAWRAFRDKWQ